MPGVVYVSPDGARAASRRRLDRRRRPTCSRWRRRRTSARRRRSRRAAQDISKDLRRKVVNDAAASLARARARARPQRAVGRARGAQGVEPRRATRRCEMNVIDVVAPTPAGAAERDRRHARPMPQGLTLAHRRRRGRRRRDVASGSALLDTLIDPNIIALLLSLGVARDRRRALEPGLVIFPARSARSALDHRRSSGSRCCRQLGRRAADAARGRLLRRRRCFVADARRADAGRRGRVRVRRAAALRPGRAGVPGRRCRSSLAIAGTLGAASWRSRSARSCRRAGDPSRSVSDDLVGDEGVRAHATASSSCTASSGRRAAPTASRSSPASRSRRARRRGRPRGSS